MKPFFLIALLLATLQSVAADFSIKSSHLDLANLPKRVVVIDPEIYVKEISVGGMAERVEAWSEQAKNNVMDTIDAQIDANGIFQTISVPNDLSDEEVDLLDEHLALFDLVGFNAIYYGRGDKAGWKHKKNEFDYTLGAGLMSLGEKLNADAALFIIGEDYISSGGRKAARIFAALMGVMLPASPTFLSVALVDLKTGDILWMNYDVALDTQDLRKAEDVQDMLGDLFHTYPGYTGVSD